MMTILRMSLRRMNLRLKVEKGLEAASVSYQTACKFRRGAEAIPNLIVARSGVQRPRARFCPNLPMRDKLQSGDIATRDSPHASRLPVAGHLASAGNLLGRSALRV